MRNMIAIAWTVGTSATAQDVGASWYCITRPAATQPSATMERTGVSSDVGTSGFRRTRNAARQPTHNESAYIRADCGPSNRFTNDPPGTGDSSVARTIGHRTIAATVTPTSGRGRRHSAHAATIV